MRRSKRWSGGRGGARRSLWRGVRVSCLGVQRAARALRWREGRRRSIQTVSKWRQRFVDRRLDGMATGADAHACDNQPEEFLNSRIRKTPTTSRAGTARWCGDGSPSRLTRHPEPSEGCEATSACRSCRRSANSRRTARTQRLFTAPKGPRSRMNAYPFDETRPFPARVNFSRGCRG